jgi:hypothetical protein
MSTYAFSRPERYAVFTAHREVCWLCGEPLGIVDMQVDHIVPEHLDGKPELEEVKRELGLPDSFSVHSFENWMPAHPRCNRTKGGHMFKPTPLIQGFLERAARKAPEAREMRESYATNRRVNLAIETLLHASEAGTLGADQRERMRELLTFHEANRIPQDRGRPLQLLPGVVISEAGNILLFKGATGLIGARPKGDNVHSSWNCPNCGVTGWNGARCVICGMLNDE